MLRLAFDFIITWRETRTRPNAYNYHVPYCMRCTCQAQRDVHLGQHEMYISSIQSLLFQEKK